MQIVWPLTRQQRHYLSRIPAVHFLVRSNDAGVFLPRRNHMDIRDATSTEASAIATFVSSIASEHIASSLGEGGLKKLLDSMDAHATQQRIDEGWPHICAFVDDDLAAIVVVKPPTHLYHLFVRSDLQRTGIGKTILGLADAWCIKTSGTRLATVNSSLNAVHIYKCLDFDTDGAVLDTDGVRYQPMIRRDSE